MSKEDFIPAFPKCADWQFHGTVDERMISSDQCGMSLRQYAAIHLRQPDSGTDWLDDMIRKSKIDEFVKDMMTRIAVNSLKLRNYENDSREIRKIAELLYR